MRINWKLTTIIIIAAVLRLWNLGINPPHLTPDEAALGYNAYSILKTGRDEYGEFLPIIFKSFGDFKPGFYIYTAVPTIAIFGLTEFAVRLPSALAGVVAVWFVYKIMLLFLKHGISSTDRKDKKEKSQIKNRELLAVITSAMLAISPWHIHFSRGAWEVNMALTLTLAGMYFFLKSFDTIKNLYVSAFFFGLTLIAYQGAKLSVLIVLIILSLVYWKKVKIWFTQKKSQKVLALSSFIGVVIALPVFLSFTNGQTGRLKVFSIFSYRRPDEYLEEQLDLAEVEFASAEYYAFYSEGLNTLRGILGRWFNHYTGRFLFFDGDWAHPRHSAPDSGQMLLADSIFLILGLAFLSKNSDKKWAKFIILWLLLAPLPSALSRDEVHAVRALNLVVPLTMTTSLGIYYLIENMSSYRFWGKLTAYGLLCVFYTTSLFIYLDNYFIHQPVHNSQYWEYGYKQIVETVTPIQDKYHTIHVRQSFAQPYVYFLFYQQYDPKEYQKQANLVESEYGDVGRVEHLDNISFLPIDWQRNRGDFGTLFVADPIRIPPEDSKNPDEFRIIKEIDYLDGKETAFRLVEVLGEENVNYEK